MRRPICRPAMRERWALDIKELMGEMGTTHPLKRLSSIAEKKTKPAGVKTDEEEKKVDSA